MKHCQWRRINKRYSSKEVYGLTTELITLASGQNGKTERERSG